MAHRSIGPQGVDLQGFAPAIWGGGRYYSLGEQVYSFKDSLEVFGKPNE
jgi:hypothetical protein